MSASSPHSFGQTTVNMDIPRQPHGSDHGSHRGSHHGSHHGSYTGYPQDNRQSKSDFVYVNEAYVGSVNSVNSNRLYQPPTTVIREQYWACSKWSFAQRTLALAVGVLLGTVISLVAIILLKDKDDNDLTKIFSRPSAPD